MLRRGSGWGVISSSHLPVGGPIAVSIVSQLSFSVHTHDRPGSLGNNLPGVKLHKHGCVSLEVFYRNGKSEIIEEEELKLEMVEFGKR